MTLKFSTDTGLRPAERRSLDSTAESVQAGLALLAKLEASLQASQEALLSHNLSLFEQHTGEQIRLRSSLEILWSRDTARPLGIDPGHDLVFSPEMRAALARVLHLGRVQAALLVRAQRWQSVVSNLLAGAEANYAAPNCSRTTDFTAGMHSSGIPNVTTGTSEAEERAPCRA